MDKRHEQILNDFGQELKTTLNIPCLLPGLVKRKLLTDAEIAQLRHPNKPDLEKNDEFMNILKTKGSKAFGKFLEALKEEDQHLGHEDLYEKLSNADKAYQLKIRNAMSSNSSQSSVEAVADSANPLQSTRSDTVILQQDSRRSSPIFSRKNSASSIGTSVGGTVDGGIMSVASETRIMAALDRLDSSFSSLRVHVDQSIKNLESKIDTLKTSVNKMELEVQFLKSRPGSSSTIESNLLGSCSSAYDADFSSGESDSSLHPRHKARRAGSAVQKTKTDLRSDLRYVNNPSKAVVSRLSSVSDSTFEYQKMKDAKHLPSLSNNFLLSSDSSDYMTCSNSEIIPNIDLAVKWKFNAKIETRCTCKRSQVPPVFYDNMIHFVVWDGTGATRARNSIVRENIRSFDVLNSRWHGNYKPIGKFSSRQCIYCVTWYLGNITLLADKAKDTKPAGNLETIHHLALYTLDLKAESLSWKEISKSDISLSNKVIDPNNCIATQYDNKIIILTYSIVSQSPCINFHQFDSISFWKSSSLCLSQSKLASNIDIQLQSCVILNSKIYYSLTYGDEIQIYQTDITKIEQTDDALPMKLDHGVKQCFLSILNGYILLFCMHGERVEVEALDPKTPMKGKFSYTFSSSVTLVAVETFTGIGKGDMVMVYHDSSANQCYLLIWKTD